MKSLIVKSSLVCAFLVLFAACENGINPSGQIYDSGVYKAIGGEINIPEMIEYSSTGLLITRVSDSKMQSAYAVPNTTKVTVTSSAAGAAIATAKASVAEPHISIKPVGNSVEGYFPPSSYLPQVEEAINAREYELTRQSVRAAPYPRNRFVVGEIWANVNLYSYEYGFHTSQDVVCIGESGHAYFMQDIRDTPLDAVVLKHYMDEFDKDYLKMHDNFAVEGDIDGNGKVIIIIYNFGDESTLGFFDSRDKTETADKSNFADIFYINTTVASDIARARSVNGVLVHELQHMIYFDNIKMSSEMYSASTWFNESLSMLAMYICGYYKDGTDTYITAFLQSYTSLSLTNWTSANYGFSMLFGVYFYEHFGKAAVQSLYKLSTGGIHAIEQVTSLDFNNIFLDFATALMVTGRGYTTDLKYNFSGIDFRKYEAGKENNLPPASITAAGTGYSADIQYYGLLSSVFSGKAKQIKIGKLFDGRAILKQQ